MQFKFADMQTGVVAARRVPLTGTCPRGQTSQSTGLGMWASLAKLSASENGMKVTVEAVQVLGGSG
jgi:alkylation response protein AidB-like acyl-CoA dehydrogenase